MKGMSGLPINKSIIQENQVALTAFTVLGFLENKRNLTSTIRNSVADLDPGL